MGSRVPVRTFTDWNEPTPGYLEIDLVAHNGGVASGTFIHSLVVTDVSSGWTEAVPLLAREQSLVVEGLEAISRVFPVPVRGIDSDNDSVFINPPRRGRQWVFAHSTGRVRHHSPTLYSHIEGLSQLATGAPRSDGIRRLFRPSSCAPGCGRTHICVLLDHGPGPSKVSPAIVSPATARQGGFQI